VKKQKKQKQSIRSYEREWTKALSVVDKPKDGGALPFIKALAQLSYENQQLRRRMATAESLLFSMSTGMVLGRDGDEHLAGCSVREGNKTCDCGSDPQRKG